MMAENLSKTSATAVPGKNIAKNAALTTTALRPINGDGNTRKINLKQLLRDSTYAAARARRHEEAQKYKCIVLNSHAKFYKKSEFFRPPAPKSGEEMEVDSSDDEVIKKSGDAKVVVILNPSYKNFFEEIKSETIKKYADVSPRIRQSTPLANLKQKQSFKSQKQDNLPINPYLADSQKFNIFEDRTSESEAFNDENSNPAPSTKSCSSPEYIADSPSGLKEPSFSYCKKKKERIRSELIWNTPYRHDIYGYLREIELKFRPNHNYMAKQTDISMKMRSILVDWFIEVGEEYKMQSETLHLAVSYVDRFLSHMSVLRVKLQLIGVASMFLASKFEEIYPPELKDFVFITDNTFTKKQVLRMEHLILKVLNFDVSVPTAYTFQQLYCSMCNASESVIYLSQYFCELSLIYGDPYLKFRPSIIAAGSIALANYTLGFNMWDDNIAETSGYQLSDLTHVILCLYNTYSNVGGCAYQAAYEKFKKNKFGCVANVHHPPKLIFPDKTSRKLCYL